MSAYTALAMWYDALTPDVPYGEFCALYARIFSEIGQVKSVLDLACGTGTITGLLAAKGYEMIASDASADMLSKAQEKLYGSDFTHMPLLLCQSMEELDLYGTVDAAVCALDAVNYVEFTSLREAFRRLHLFIRPKGVFIFDILSPDRLRALDGDVGIDETDDVFCVWRMSCEDERVTYSFDLFESRGDLWSRESEEHTEYIHEPDALLKLLLASGFASAEIIPDAPMRDAGRIFIKAVNGEQNG